ncbi:MAG: lamin tail domain-containing protein, partial [Sedimentisphaerales bacterium]|nr:lamin tail domain-containing protein [Sedimentisphaerales bacterium]
YLLGGDGTNDSAEPYDYPGDVDRWLADLEPFMFVNNSNADPCDDFVIWRHITDLYENNFDPPAITGPPFWYGPQNKNDLVLWDSSNIRSLANIVYWNNNWWFFGRNVSDEESTEAITDGGSWNVAGDVYRWGAQADADGDGIADARWVKIPSIIGPRGENCYTAVRIIDNCGMINVNTAFRNTENLSPAEDWDGSETTHVDLRGICKGNSLPTDLDNAITNWHHYRCGWLDINPVPPVVSSKDYYNYVGRSVLNPDPGANLVTAPTLPILFDFTDELELRNRFFLNGPSQVRSENFWLETFLPGYPNTIKRPYDNPANLIDWFQKASANGGSCYLGGGYYNRRHIATIYNFDRIITPEQDISSMPGPLKTAWDNWNNWGAANESFRPVCLEDITSANVDRLAAAIWLGLPDNNVLEKNQQIKDLKWTFTTDGVDTRKRLACLLACNIVDYIDTASPETATKLTVGSDEYYGFESEAPRLYISKLAISRYDDSIDLFDPITEQNYAIEIYNPSNTSVPRTGWQIRVVGSSPIAIPAGSDVLNTTPLVLADDIGANAFIGFEQIATFKFTDGDTIVLEDSYGTVWDAIKVPSLPSSVPPQNIQEVFVCDRGSTLISNSAGNQHMFPVWDETVAFIPVSSNPPFGNLGVFAASPDATAIQTMQAKQIRTIAEISQAFYIGSIFENGVYESMPVFFGRFLPTFAIDTGRLNYGDPIAQGIFRYITLQNFNPSHDFEDPPANTKELDNDGDGVPNEATELAIAGRININTAPWFVIKQLPWLGKWYDTSTSNFEENDNLARAIVAYRDKLKIQSGTEPAGPDYQTNYTSDPDPAESRKRGMGLNESDKLEIREDLGFASIGELLNVTQNLTSGSEGYNSNATTAAYDFRMFTFAGGYDNTASATDPFYGTFDTDTAQDDLLEQDILLDRVSNLATVRSDTFTAYIAVRIGEAGPIRRVMAIFDRSNVFSTSDTPKLVALQPVPDPD